MGVSGGMYGWEIVMGVILEGVSIGLYGWELVLGCICGR